MAIKYLQNTYPVKLGHLKEWFGQRDFLWRHNGFIFHANLCGGVKKCIETIQSNQGLASAMIFKL
jgi:hypothetical protein